MAQGNYDHPTYLTRQILQFQGLAAGAAGTSGHQALPLNMRLRAAQVTIRTAGTVGTNVQAILFAGTLALGTGSFGTGGQTIGQQVAIADMNATVTSGTVLSVKNGADATAITAVAVEAYVDPAATWTGAN